jgi:hypothetical protein
VTFIPSHSPSLLIVIVAPPGKLHYGVEYWKSQKAKEGDSEAIDGNKRLVDHNPRDEGDRI